MNVFEDLVVELMEENLLEETVALSPQSNGKGSGGTKPNGNGNGHKNGNGKSPVKIGPESYRPHAQGGSSGMSLSDQMAALQFVEFVISSTEKLCGGEVTEFDELQVQKALHRYTQAGSDPESDGNLEAESALVDSLRSWEDDLTKRDAEIPASALRRFAESANPPLSPQALFALVRFYRRVPVSENSYLKFDFVLTRLFSKFVDGERREMLCSRDDVVKHLNQRYSAWGMNALSALQGDDPDVAVVCISFEDFAAEISSVLRLSELVKAKFFERLYEFKLGSGAMLFVPKVSAAAIESNLAISQKLCDLVDAEIERGGVAKLSGIDVELVSNAIGRTFEIEMGESASLIGSGPGIADVTRPAKMPPPGRKVKSTSKTIDRTRHSSLFGVNRWLLIATVFSVVISLGIYLWSEYYTDETTTTAVSAKPVDLGAPELAQYIKTARVNGDTLYAVVTLNFIELSPDKRRDVVEQTRKLGDTKGYKRVTFYDPQGKTVAFGSADRTDIH